MGVVMQRCCRRGLSKAAAVHGAEQVFGTKDPTIASNPGPSHERAWYTTLFAHTLDFHTLISMKSMSDHWGGHAFL